jgi:hypothetical protein
MSYLEAQEIYQELQRNLHSAEFMGNSEIGEVRHWVKKHGKEKVRLCIKTLCDNLDLTKKHYMLILEMAERGKENE